MDTQGRYGILNSSWQLAAYLVAHRVLVLHLAGQHDGAGLKAAVRVRGETRARLRSRHA